MSTGFVLHFFWDGFFRPPSVSLTMSSFETSTGPRYVTVTFNADELAVIRSACSSASQKEDDRMDAMVNADLEQAARQAEVARDSDMAADLVALFKAGQEIVIVCDDLVPVLECLKAYEPQVPEERASALRSAMEKIGRCCGGTK